MHLTTATALILVPVAIAAQQKPLATEKGSPLNDNFNKLASSQLELWHVPGVAISVVDGESTWAQGYGLANVSTGEKVKPETLFYGASTTKAFVAASLALLISSGNHSGLSWKTTVSSLIYDDFVLDDSYSTEKITVEDILSHRTGFPRHDYSYGGSDPVTRKKYGPRDIVRSLRHLPLTAGLRERFQYCNMMFVVASHVIETLTGSWLGDFLKVQLWEPMGMKSTYFSTSDAIAAPEPLAQGYSYQEHEDKYREVPFMDLTSVSGAGSTISNVLDYSKWLRTLLAATNAGPNASSADEFSSPISKSDVKNLLAPRTLVLDKEEFVKGPKAYALGWFSGNYRGYEYFEHSGGMEAFGAQVIFFPALNYGLASFGNTGQTSNCVELSLIWHLIDNKLNVPIEERFDWDAHHLKEIKDRQARLSNATQIYYPNTPSPPLPSALSLGSYTGTYNHPAYQNITIKSCTSPITSTSINTGETTLCFGRSNASWKILGVFKHVSGEFWMTQLRSSVADSSTFLREAVPAEFIIGANGKPAKFGIALEPELDGKIWFERVD